MVRRWSSWLPSAPRPRARGHRGRANRRRSRAQPRVLPQLRGPRRAPPVEDARFGTKKVLVPARRDDDHSAQLRQSVARRHRQRRYSIRRLERRCVAARRWASRETPLHRPAGCDNLAKRPDSITNYCETGERAPADASQFCSRRPRGVDGVKDLSVLLAVDLTGQRNAASRRPPAATESCRRDSAVAA